MAFYRVRPDKARACLHMLHGLRHVHPYFIGYLGVVRAAVREGRTDRLVSPVRNLFNTYLRVTGGPVASRVYPYVKLFKGASKGVNFPEWQSDNLSGIYGYSGRRDELEKVLVIQKGKLDPHGRLVAGNRDIYALRDNHAALAFQHWCGAERVPAYPLALFLYRDLAFELDKPDTTVWVEHFRAEFGYEDAQGTPTDNYRTLFSEEGAETYAPADDWLDAYEPPADEPATSDESKTSDDSAV